MLDFDDEFLAFDWPYDSDSEPVFFRFRTKPPPDREHPVRLEIRLYSADLHLLEIMEIENILIGDTTLDDTARRKFWPSNRPANSRVSRRTRR